MIPRVPFPGGARFAFTVMDDTDVATVENVQPVYRLLESLGMRTTKTVWPVRCEEGSRNFSLSETMDDPHYLDFVVDLHARGFEIAFHGATMETSTRERTARALDRFCRVFGATPKAASASSRPILGRGSAAAARSTRRPGDSSSCSPRGTAGLHPSGICSTGCAPNAGPMGCRRPSGAGCSGVGRVTWWRAASPRAFEHDGGGGEHDRPPL